MPFAYNHGINELITHYRDIIHNRKYHNFTIVIVLFSLSFSPKIPTPVGQVILLLSGINVEASR